MSKSNSIRTNVMQNYEDLVKVNFPEPQAKAILRIIEENINIDFSNLTTKEDLNAAVANLATKTELAEFKTDVKIEMAEVKTAINTCATKTEFSELKADINASFRIMYILGAFIAIEVAIPLLLFSIKMFSSHNI